MARKAFYSFHYILDNWRAAQVRSMGVIEGNQSVSDNDWESITKGGDRAIEAWIDGQMKGKSCEVVLIGSQTAGRKWITYEIKKAWNDGKGVVGIHIHNLKSRNGQQSALGGNPFGYLTVSGVDMASIVRTYNPPYSASASVYGYIKDNIEKWVEEAISTRNRY